MIPLFSTEQIRQADKYAIEKLGIPGVVLMENASLSIFNEILKNFPELSTLDRIGIVAGKGNNAGDGFAVARHFVNKGFQVKVIALANETQLKGDALVNYLIIKNLAERNNNLKLFDFKNIRDLNKLSDCTVIIDALLGTGAKGKLREPYSSLVNKINRFNSVKVAIDLPTGLDLNNATSEDIFKADLTITLAELKTGLFYGDGYKFSGKVVKGSIGIGEEYFNSLTVKEYLVEPEDAFIGLPERQPDANKYTAGKVLLIAGSTEMPGAAIYSTNAAIYSGAGAVLLSIPRNVRGVALDRLNSAIALNVPSEDYFTAEDLNVLEEKINWADVIALGPGLGRKKATIEALLMLIDKFKSKRFVLDADAIFAISTRGYENVNLKNAVLTPHFGEFAGLLGVKTRELKSNLLKYGREFVEKTSAFLVLKGAPTLIFNTNGEVFINTSGNAGLAKFGSGDVLTGIIASFIAQSGNIEQSLISAVYLHGLDADLLSEKKTILGISAEDLIANFPTTIKFLRDSFVE